MVDLSELEQQFLGRLRAFLGNAGAINPELIEAIAGHMERMADQRLRKLAGSTGKADDAHAVRQYLEHWRGMDEPGDRCLVKALSREPCLFEVVRALVGWPPEGKQPTEPKEHARLVMEMLKSEDDDAKKALTKLHEFNVDPITEERLIQLFTEKPHAAAEVFRAAEWPRPFSLVFREELEQIEARRGSRAAPPSDAYTDALDLARCSNLFALAFSGGGIRSATFNLGVLQRLAEHGILKNVDYLSTVSGGGYIGSWLSAWSWRKGFARVCDWLSPTRHRDPTEFNLRPVLRLRQFSNYLTPELGAFSFDTWTMAAVYTRNVLLNLATLVAVFGALLLIPRLAGLALKTLWHPAGAWPLVIGLILLFVSVFMIGLNLKIANNLPQSAAFGRAKRWVAKREWGRRRLNQAKEFVAQRPSWFTPGRVQFWCLGPLLLGCALVSWYVWMHLGEIKPELPELHRPFTLRGGFWIPILVFALLSVMLSLTSGAIGGRRYRLLNNDRLSVALVLLVVIAGTTAVGWGLWRGCFALLTAFRPWPGGSWDALVWGPPLFAGMVGTTGVALMGLLGVNLCDAAREWLSRFRAVTNLYTFFWLILFAASIYGPLLFSQTSLFHTWITSLLGAGWVASTVASLLAGKSSKTGDGGETPDGVPALQIVAKIGPPIFVAGFVLAISLGIHLLTVQNYDEGDLFKCLFENYWYDLNSGMFAVSLTQPLGLWLLCLAAAGILIWRVDINEFSMHHFYKNRLVRCYLGASNPNRKPNAFTGFDDADDVRLSSLKAKPEHGQDRYAGPYPIINATLNLSAGKNLAWQERKAASFIFTPCFSGYDVSQGGEARTTEILRPCAYRPTNRYAFQEGPHIGTTVAISGAAANPNQGYNTSPTVAFLMTVFDVRLGWWLGNPRRDKESKRSSPVFGLVALLSELIGTTDDETRFVSLSDGGHFDNMGLYELVRRRCKYIILCDAEQDPQYQFEGLGVAIRKCRIDFGAEIDIDPSQIKPDPKTKLSAAHCAVGTISYSDGSDGVLLYIKSSVTGDEPEDVLEYRTKEPDFPHDTTANQWFGESQFESYRKLGYSAADNALAPAQSWVAHHSSVTKDVAEHQTRALFDALQKHWYPQNPGLPPNAIKHTQSLTALLDKLGSTAALHELGKQLFPGNTWPQNVEQRDQVQEFYVSMAVLQLVEDVFYDFSLEKPKWRKDPRIGGWMTLFRTWKQSSAIQSAWRTQKRTFREDFQVFWEEQIKPDDCEA